MPGPTVACNGLCALWIDQFCDAVLGRPPFQGHVTKSDSIAGPPTTTRTNPVLLPVPLCPGCSFICSCKPGRSDGRHFGPAPARRLPLCATRPRHHHVPPPALACRSRPRALPPVRPRLPEADADDGGRGGYRNGVRTGRCGGRRDMREALAGPFRCRQ
ncbi:hypothetical protein DFJ74DRAFT_273457 [Hyaloraphidium curvatum]|nr:hypothetical protein DFJ74DRAFT_273457 [Hyaloraphidium curvatum]